jgi:hypothetical protein
MSHEIIYKLYPTVVTIRGDIAYDAEGNEVAYDLSAIQSYANANAYKEKRAAEYPDFKDYLDGIVKGDQAQMQAYIDACNAVKNKYPKEQL